MRATSRSILAAGTIATAAIVGAGVTVLGADDADVTTRLGQVGPSTSVDFITVPRSVASTSTSTSSSTSRHRRSTSTTMRPSHDADRDQPTCHGAGHDRRGNRHGSQCDGPRGHDAGRHRPDDTGPDDTGPDVTVTTIDDRGGDDDDHSGPGHGGDDDGDDDHSGPAVATTRRRRRQLRSTAGGGDDD